MKQPEPRPSRVPAPSSAPALAASPSMTLTDADLKTLYQLLVSVRQLDKAAVAWQRQGIFPTYAPALGQEAAQVGSAYVLDRTRDFAFPTYREIGVARALGVNMAEYLATHKALWHGGLYDPVTSRLAPIQAVVAGSVLHAVGWALGAKLDAADTTDLPVAMTYFGDGASSQGDVHEAMNFAGVMQVPVVFFVQNNCWAISLPTHEQVAGNDIAARAHGYGMPALRIDGNDVTAVIDACSRAVAHARAGRGPVLVEALTYRRGPHSTSDDPGRYRSLEQERADAGDDPIEMLRRALEAGGDIAEAFFTDVQTNAEQEQDEVFGQLAAMTTRPGREMFDYVFQQPTAVLRAQQAHWQSETEYDA
ncbi:pyruvate dehydrogenase E1 (lipoamide) alpha subunit [Salinisphaera sp. T5B8]